MTPGRWHVLLLVLPTWLGCWSDQCLRQSDCATGYACESHGQCQLVPDANLQTDGNSPSDATFRDGSVHDASVVHNDARATVLDAASDAKAAEVFPVHSASTQVFTDLSGSDLTRDSL